MPLNPTLPTVGASRDAWGGILNTALTDTATYVNGLENTINANPGIPRYASVAARDTAIPTPTAGQLAYTPTTGVFIYEGAWVPLPGTIVFEGRASATQNIATPGPTLVNFPTNRYLPYGQTRTTNFDRYVLPYPGRYLISAFVILAINTNGTRTALISFNGNNNGLPGAYDASPNGNSFYPVLHMTGTATTTTTTDYVCVPAFSTSAAVDTFYATPHAVATLRVVYLGPNY